MEERDIISVKENVNIGRKRLEREAEKEWHRWRLFLYQV